MFKVFHFTPRRAAVVAALGAALALPLMVSTPAEAWWRGGWGGWHGGGWGGWHGGCCWHSGVSIGIGIPLYAPPPVYYAPPPAYYPPPAYFPPQSPYGFAPTYYGGYASPPQTFGGNPGFVPSPRLDPNNCGTPDRPKPCTR